MSLWLADHTPAIAAVLRTARPVIPRRQAPEGFAIRDAAKDHLMRRWRKIELVLVLMRRYHHAHG
jgi:hypothetical protein